MDPIGFAVNIDALVAAAYLVAAAVALGLLRWRGPRARLADTAIVIGVLGTLLDLGYLASA